MNKTVNINIGGLFFHIDENAYGKLNNYLESIKGSLAEDSKEEVMNDIEIRISEILTSRIQADKQVVNILDIEHIISIMGQPEDYIIEDDSNNNQQKKYTSTNDSSLAKKLFRDEDEGKIGGVCAGLGHYFGLDNIWIRLIFIVLFFTTGSSLLIYLILWIVIPKATTTTEKLQMHGEPINISNIEKKFKETFDNEQLNKTSKKAVSVIENFAKQLLNVLSKIFGVFLLFISIVSLGGILVFGSIFILNATQVIDNIDAIGIPFESYNLFWFGILIIITVGIPLLFLFFLSLKILNSNFKLVGKYTTLSLIALWFLSIFGWTAWGINQASKEKFQGKKTTRIELNLTANDTLNVNLNNNTFYSSEENPNYTGKIMLNENGDKVLYSNRVEVIFKETEEQPYLLLEKSAKGSDIENATKLSEEINYKVEVSNKDIIADNYFTSTQKNNKNKPQIKLYVYIPKNVVVKQNKEARYFSNTFLNSNQESNNPLFKFDENNQLNCINCNTNITKNNTIPSHLLEHEVDSILNAIN